MLCEHLCVRYVHACILVFVVFVCVRVSVFMRERERE